MTQITGDLNFAMDTSLYSTFVQDDWQIAPNVKMLYGVRYDLYQYPDRAGDAPLASDAELQHRQEQLRPARRRGLVA